MLRTSRARPALHQLDFCARGEGALWVSWLNPGLCQSVNGAHALWGEPGPRRVGVLFGGRRARFLCKVTDVRSPLEVLSSV